MTTSPDNTDEQKTKENKEIKEARKEINEIMKNNQEVLETIAEDGKKSAERMEMQIASIGDKISTTVGVEIANLARIMTNFLTKENKPEEPRTQRKTIPSTTDQREDDQSNEKDDEEENTDEITDDDQNSLPCGQTKFLRITQTQTPTNKEPIMTEENQQRKVLNKQKIPKPRRSNKTTRRQDKIIRRTS